MTMIMMTMRKAELLFFPGSNHKKPSWVQQATPTQSIFNHLHCSFDTIVIIFIIIIPVWMGKTLEFCQEGEPPVAVISKS